MSTEIRLLRKILDSLPEACFVFDRNGACLPIHSQNCEKLLGVAPAGRSAVEVLRVSDVELETFNSWCGHIFAGSLDFEDLASLGPAILPRGDGRHIEISYRPLRDDSGELEAVLAIVADRTDELTARREAEGAKSRAEMILRLTGDREQFFQFVDLVEGVVVRLREPDREKLPATSAVKRDFHTLKGAALSFHILELTAVFQTFEKRVALLEGADPVIRENEYRACATRIETALKLFLTEHRHLVGERA